MPGPETHAIFELLYLGAPGLYALYLLADLLAPRAAGWLLGAGVLTHLAGLTARGVAIDYFPLTNKFESFYMFAWSCFAVGLLVMRSPSRVHRLGLFAIGGLFYGLTWLFDPAVHYPPPLMHTIWYPLHVPASFLSYALWTSAAAAGLATLLAGPRGPVQAFTETHAFWGFCVFSVSMIFGGAWGYVAWGTWFLWDPKVVWSVIAWLFYGAFVHLKYWPAGNRPRPKSLLAVAGFLVTMVTYVGTSFLFSNSSHSFD